MFREFELFVNITKELFDKMLMYVTQRGLHLLTLDKIDQYWELY